MTTQRTRDWSKAIWTVIAAAIGLLALGCAIQGFLLDMGGLIQLGLANAPLLLAAAILRRRGWLKCANYLTAIAQMAILSAAAIFLTYVLASTNLPLQDARLEALDGALGIDWRSLVGAFMRYPNAMFVLNVAYASFNYQLFLLAPLLLLTPFEAVGQRLVFAWSLALMLTVLVFPFVPALGGFLHYAIQPADVPLVRVQASWLYVDRFLEARDGSLRVLDLATLDGIVTFPSFHAAVAVLVGWAAWQVPLVRWPVVAWNAIMWISAIPIGAHYVVDVLAGSLVAAFAIWLVQGRPSEALRRIPRFGRPRFGETA